MTTQLASWRLSVFSLVFIPVFQSIPGKNSIFTENSAIVHSLTQSGQHSYNNVTTVTPSDGTEAITVFFVNNTTEANKKDWRLLQEKQSNRTQNAQRECQTHPSRKKTLSPSSFASLLVDSIHHVTFCVVGKVGSTSWTTLMLERVGKYNVPLTEHVKLINSGQTSLSYITKYDKNNARDIFEKYFHVVFGRNPWTRLLSAFSDKFENTSDRKYYHDIYGKNIIKRYRKNASSISLRTGNDVTFTEFVAWVVDEIKAKKHLDAHWKSIDEVRSLSTLLLLCAVTGGFPHKWPVMRSFYFPLVVRLDKLWNKYLRCRWFETSYHIEAEYIDFCIWRSCFALKCHFHTPWIHQNNLDHLQNSMPVCHLGYYRFEAIV